MDDHELYKAVNGVDEVPKILPYARVRYRGGVIEIVLVAYDEHAENHISVGLEVSDELAEMLEQCSWDNT
jgi:hypothetical protein